MAILAPEHLDRRHIETFTWTCACPQRCWLLFIAGCWRMRAAVLGVNLRNTLRNIQRTTSWNTKPRLYLYAFCSCSRCHKRAQVTWLCEDKVFPKSFFSSWVSCEDTFPSSGSILHWTDKHLKPLRVWDMSALTHRMRRTGLIQVLALTSWNRWPQRHFWRRRPAFCTI